LLRTTLLITDYCRWPTYWWLNDRLPTTDDRDTLLV